MTKRNDTTKTPAPNRDEAGQPQAPEKEPVGGITPTEEPDMTLQFVTPESRSFGPGPGLVAGALAAGTRQAKRQRSKVGQQRETLAETPAIAQAVAAYEAVEANAEAASAAHSAAEAAVYELREQGEAAAKAAMAAVPAPAILTITSDPYLVSCVMTWSDGRQDTPVKNEVPPVYVMTRRDEIIRHCGGDAGQAAPKFAALKQWEKEKEKAAAAAAPAWSRAVRAERRADKVSVAAYEACDTARDAILAVPVTTVAQALEKQRAYFATLGLKIARDGSYQVAGRRTFDISAAEDYVDKAHEALMRDLMGLSAEPTPAPEPDTEADDADLLALAAEYAVAQEDYRAADAEHDRLYDIYRPLRPAPTEAMFMRGRDWELVQPGLMTRAKDNDGYYAPSWLSEIRAIQEKTAAAVAANASPYAPKYLQERLARLNELVAALEAWKAADQQVYAETGAKAAEEAMGAAEDRQYALLRKLIATPARTLAGVAAKAEALKPELRDLEDSFAEAFALRVVNDLLGLRGRVG